MVTYKSDCELWYFIGEGSSMLPTFMTYKRKEGYMTATLIVFENRRGDISRISYSSLTAIWRRLPVPSSDSLSLATV